MISTSSYDSSFAFSTKTAKQLHVDSLGRHPTTINRGNQGAVMTDKPENLEMSIMSEVAYANHAAAINPGIKVFTNQSGEDGWRLHEYLKSINFNSKQWN